MTGMQTVMRPARRLEIPDMQAMQVIRAAERLRETERCGSSSDMSINRRAESLDSSAMVGLDAVDCWGKAQAGLWGQCRANGVIEQFG